MHVLYDHDENPEITRAWAEAGAKAVAPATVGAFVDAYQAGEDVLYLRWPTWPYKLTEMAPWALPVPSLDKVVTPVSPEGGPAEVNFVNSADLYRQAGTGNRVFYPRGFPCALWWQGARYDWGANNQRIKPGIFCFPTSPPDVSAHTALVLRPNCEGLNLMGGKARGALLPRWIFTPMGGAVLIARDVIPAFPVRACLGVDVDALDDTIAAYMAQVFCHATGRACGFGLPVLRRESVGSPYSRMEAEAPGLESLDRLGMWLLREAPKIEGKLEWTPRDLAEIFDDESRMLYPWLEGIGFWAGNFPSP